jgi:hypothetical protein
MPWGVMMSLLDVVIPGQPVGERKAKVLSGATGRAYTPKGDCRVGERGSAHPSQCMDEGANRRALLCHYHGNILKTKASPQKKKTRTKGSLVMSSPTLIMW